VGWYAVIQGCFLWGYNQEIFFGHWYRDGVNVSVLPRVPNDSNMACSKAKYLPTVGNVVIRIFEYEVPGKL
jgi:hypothetical protein